MLEVVASHLHFRSCELDSGTQYDARPHQGAGPLSNGNAPTCLGLPLQPGATVAGNRGKLIRPRIEFRRPMRSSPPGRDSGQPGEMQLQLFRPVPERRYPAPRTPPPNPRDPLV